MRIGRTYYIFESFLTPYFTLRFWNWFYSWHLTFSLNLNLLKTLMILFLDIHPGVNVRINKLWASYSLFIRSLLRVKLCTICYIYGGLFRSESNAKEWLISIVIGCQAFAIVWFLNLIQRLWSWKASQSFNLWDIGLFNLNALFIFSLLQIRNHWMFSMWNMICQRPQAYIVRTANRSVSYHTTHATTR